MNKEELCALVAELLQKQEPMVKGSDYKTRDPGPQKQDQGSSEGDFVPDVTALDGRTMLLPRMRYFPRSVRTSRRSMGCWRSRPDVPTRTST